MSGQHLHSFDPFEEMHTFYSLDDPTEEQQFRFVEAMKLLIDRSFWEEDIPVLSFNLAMYYRGIKEFGLEQRYLELAAKYNDCCSKEELGFIAYYGLTGEQDFEKAYHYFSECKMRKSKYMIADMYHYGQHVRCDRRRCREILEDLFEQVEPERNDPSFATSTLFPEIAQRLVQLDLEEGTETDYDWNSLLDARAVLTKRQQKRPFWGNILTMRSILETMREMRDRNDGFIDLYDLLTFDRQNAGILFDYDDATYHIHIFQHEGETIYEFNGRWFHGPDDFLEKARIDGKRITTVDARIENIQIHEYDTS